MSQQVTIYYFKNKREIIINIYLIFINEIFFYKMKGARNNHIVARFTPRQLDFLAKLIGLRILSDPAC